MSRERPRGPLGEEALAALAGVVRRETEDPPGAAAERGRERALAAFRRDRARAARRATAGRVLLVAAAFAGMVALVAAMAFFPRAPLRFTVDGAPATAGGYLPAGATLRFTDGSVVAFASDAGGRIAACGPEGARVVLESGTASFQVAHRPGARWSVEAGPFVIAVVGTVFDASWSPTAQALEVDLHQGEVSVRGPAAPGGVHLREGQRLKALARDGELVVSRVDAPAVARAPSAVREPDAPREAAPVPPIPVSASVAPPAAPLASRAALGWPQRVAAGDFVGVVRSAEARGADAVARLTLADLGALADAARYVGRPELARRALLEERARFAGTPEARAAAFLLGRLAEDSGGSPAVAVRWYDAYLDEAAGGAFADEALGRKLTALRASGDPAAGVAAAEYLRRYPEGPYAARAREVLAGR